MGVREIEIAGQTIVIHELDDVCDSVTGRVLTGSWVWDSALVLSEWMSTQLHFQAKSVLELGAGAGLPGLTAARLGATRVVLTDVAPLIPGLLKNVEANGLGDRVEVRELVWGTNESLSRLSELGEFDVVLMSDVFVDPEEMEELGKVLKRVCREGRTRVWAASEFRSWTSECLNELVSQGFEVVEFPSQLGSVCSCSLVGERDGSLDMFAIFNLIPPVEGTCHVAETELEGTSMDLDLNLLFI